MEIAFDIETIPSQKAGAREQARAGIKPPGTLKKPETIAAWWETEAPVASEEAYRRQALDGGLHGEIISIAACTDDDRQWVRCRRQGESEAELIGDFVKTVESWMSDDAAGLAEGINWTTDPELVAHNAAFDMPFLWRRCIVNGIRPERWMPGPLARPGKDFHCTMTKWAGFGKYITLDSLCQALDIESPKAEGFGGADVFEAWLAGRYCRIEAYNLGDALATMAVWHGLYGGPRPWRR